MHPREERTPYFFLGRVLFRTNNAVCLSVPWDDRAEDLKRKVQASGRPPLTGTLSEKKDRRRAKNAVATRKLRAAKKAKAKR